MRVLITRPREDAEALAEALAVRGVEALVEPLLEIVPLNPGDFDLAGVQAALLTSANGARALAAATGSRDVPVLAVGEATAAAARAAGFAEVAVAGGDV
ncbi:MAG: uroporphyrinogen-III synthase, partial [Alphaproteobacteria bacterium]